ncbi:ABC-type Na+ efflux pump, permease component OS=Singulisphaera acidiphila (strain ATCC BAA-1392 / DSM 18658 / VKM B-2454 / MOB10) GN=Sinac_6077 PE=4 SV=1: ABC2_membrane_2 [Gemmataceae bacterium]|nr:ABC-type Na+ efflux pump, permease component OS=Singulisphaera acidiphila (strain ATCC BAA-1392 / DSM 18658 / VKM B-2454 / MOB10) GN=Sinac_6077 PE=4 SV=1: ABC2_membrane_2 [Gemmataceae bacterium]VTU00150.1 ABC-type Na+ efflux pump, permease component OS=Singulisphaera acidiphila (strain ATCC BAA-1392 / DSM 18658 / VKM B-2454 / MOB10) GN=Sinac_6077 PE=4 SV=1: ABC2_membrane_2 [Gemmataceae bacterium]
MPRWSVVRLIANREVRDQLRDRRTLFLILGLPVVMYPLFVGIGLLFVAAIKEKVFVVAVAGAEHLPQPQPEAVPPPVAAVGGAAAAVAERHARTFPPLVTDGKFDPRFLENSPDGGSLTVKLIAAPDEGLLDRREADAILVVPADFVAKLDRGERPVLQVLGREGEENSKIAVRRLTGAIHSWVERLKSVRFARAGLSADFDSPVEVRDPQTGKAADKKVFDELRDVLVKTIPFLLVMWMLTGAIYPAIDMTAGEKERGTMETLLISPAERIEIVLGKFAAVVTMGFGTAAWNVLLMLLVTAAVQVYFPHTLIYLPGLAMCMLAALPLAMLIAASTLALGIFARSTKEGNYYMVPMFFVTLPLAYWSMSPGMELDGATSWVPVANALLLQQRLMAVRTDPFPWQHVPAVVGSLVLCVGVTLWAAVRQFQRESVLFREAEGSGGGWSLFGRKK